MTSHFSDISDFRRPEGVDNTCIPAKALQNHQSHQSSKVMPEVILKRLKPQAEELMAEGQAELRAGRSTI